MKKNFVLIVTCFWILLQCVCGNVITFEKDYASLQEDLPDVETICNSDVFGGDVNAVRSCMTAYALQYNWYPSPIAGLFSYQTWNGFDGFWQNGAVLESLANFMFYANNSMYKSVITGSIRDVYSLLEAYYPQPSFDDMAWYGLSYARIHEVLGSNDNSQTNFLYEARRIYDWIWQNGWDTSHTCQGGVWFDQTRLSKQNVENSQILLLGGKLYRLTKDETLLGQIEKMWNFIESNQLISNSTYMVADGINANCSSNQVYGPTYNMGLMIGGLLEAGQALNRSEEMVSIAHKIALATINNSTKNGILTEYCSPNCNDDAKMFKGIFMRNLRYLIDYTRKHNDSEGSKHMDLYENFIKINSDTVWSNNSCYPTKDNCSIVYKDGRPLRNPTAGPIFGVNYAGPFNYSAPMQQVSVLDLFVSGISSRTTCKGDSCKFDPPIPQPHPLTCKDNPCPVDQPCCEWKQEYYTCCESTQKCQNGECI